MGAYLNVKINAGGLKDKEFVDNVLSEAELIVSKTNSLESEIIAIVLSKV
jgi:glutamate formiminotransferase/formiminotetrahydrofolate cyclodeaminase